MTGLRFVDMDEQKLEETVRRAVRAEITHAFKEVGLHDDDAPADVRDLRTLLRTYKQAQSTVLKTILTFITLAFLGLVSFGTFNKINGGD